MLKLGLRLELYRSPTVQVPYDLVQRAEELGYHSVWTAEAYGAEASSPLAYVGALTERIKLGTASRNSPVARRRRSRCTR